MSEMRIALPAGAESSKGAGTESAPAPRRFTVGEYYRMADAGILGPDERVELLDGEIFVMSPIGSFHAFCVAFLTKWFIRALAAGQRLF